MKSENFTKLLTITCLYIDTLPITMIMKYYFVAIGYITNQDWWFIQGIRFILQIRISILCNKIIRFSSLYHKSGLVFHTTN